MQVVGRPCAECGRAIMVSTDAEWCADCGYVGHRRCLPRAETYRDNVEEEELALCPRCGSAFSNTADAEAAVVRARARTRRGESPAMAASSWVLLGCGIMMVFATLVALLVFARLTDALDY